MTKFLLRSGKYIEADTSDEACLSVSNFKPGQRVVDVKEYPHQNSTVIGVGRPTSDRPLVLLWAIDGDLSEDHEQLVTYICSGFSCSANEFLKPV